MRVLARVPLSNPGAGLQPRGGPERISGGEAAAFVFSGLGSGLVTVAGVLRCRAGVEQGLAVAAAEQEDEPFQVAA
jgi:hypothetical protein